MQVLYVHVNFWNVSYYALLYNCNESMYVRYQAYRLVKFLKWKGYCFLSQLLPSQCYLHGQYNPPMKDAALHLQHYGYVSDKNPMKSLFFFHSLPGVDELLEKPNMEAYSEHLVRMVYSHFHRNNELLTTHICYLLLLHCIH